MTDKLTLRGLAIPFDQEITIRGVRETVAPGAFAAQRGDVDLVAGDHEGASFARVSTLFSYAKGLGFEASLGWDDSSALWFAKALRQDTWRCSVWFDTLDADTDTRDGVEHRRITAATVSHICLTREPAYPTTACWLADMGSAEMGADLARAVAAWDLGRLVHDRKVASLAACDQRHKTLAPDTPVARRSPAVGVRGVRSSGRPVPASLVNLLASPGFRDAAARQAAGSRFLAGGGGGGQSLEASTSRTGDEPNLSRAPLSLKRKSHGAS